MASTHNKNTPNDYCLEQRQFALGGKYTTYEYSQYGHAYNPAMPCVGIIPTNLSRDVDAIISRYAFLDGVKEEP